MKGGFDREMTYSLTPAESKGDLVTHEEHPEASDLGISEIVWNILDGVSGSTLVLKRRQRRNIQPISIISPSERLLQDTGFTTI